MKTLVFATSLSTIVLLGCAQHEAVMLDPDGKAVPTYALYTVLQAAVQWFIPCVLLILASAAFIHWRLTMQRSLLIFAIAAVMMASGVVAGQLGELPMQGATIDEIASGQRAPIQWLMTTRQLLAALGFALAGVGGIVAIVSGVRKSRKSSNCSGSPINSNAS